MKSIKTILSSALLATCLISSSIVSAQSTDEDVTIIELTQVPGELSTQELNLAPGKYQFRVVNQSVDHEVGFVIQKKSDMKVDVMKSAVENSFTTSTIKKGNAEYTGVVTLTEGEYVYSCPLNPTPQYALTVK